MRLDLDKITDNNTLIDINNQFDKAKDEIKILQLKQARGLGFLPVIQGIKRKAYLDLQQQINQRLVEVNQILEKFDLLKSKPSLAIIDRERTQLAEKLNIILSVTRSNLSKKEENRMQLMDQKIKEYLDAAQKMQNKQNGSQALDTSTIEKSMLEIDKIYQAAVNAYDNQLTIQVQKSETRELQVLKKHLEHIRDKKEELSSILLDLNHKKGLRPTNFKL